MLFNSIPFLLFFPTICGLYYCIPADRVRLRNIFLLVASYYFYMSWQPVYSLLLLTSTAVTYLAALGIDYYRDRRKQKVCLVASLVLNLSILFLFKYYNFLAANIVDAMNVLGLRLEIPVSKLLLPVGISFYTFQALGYSIDVYRGTTRVERDFLTYALFVSFFPQLVAGPIERSNNLLPQFREKRTFDYESAMQGVRMMVWGYFLKLVLADRCGTYVDAVFYSLDKHNGGSYLIASLLFPFQIYGDFAGYSLIAIGAARILGFRLMDNFRRPYLSCSVGEFWHRWHISLSTWFKDYVYIPLGGNRVGRLRQYFNLMVTFVVSGLWHGANWTFVCWGALHGALLCVEKALGIGRREYHGLSRFLHWSVTFILVCLAWIFFRADTLSDACTIFTGIFTKLGVPFVKASDFGVIALSIGLLLLIALRQENLVPQKTLPSNRLGASSFLSFFAIALMIAIIILFGVLDSSQFIYFQF